MFRKRPERIRRIAGSLDDRAVVVVDGTTGAGPGIARVVAEAGADVLLATSDHVALDLQLRELANTAGRVTGWSAPIGTAAEQLKLLEGTEQPLEMVVINPSALSFVTDGSQLDAQQAVNLARLAAGSMQDRGTEGSIVFVTGIRQSGSNGSAVAFLDAEMEQLAREYAPNAIRVNAVAPGHVAVSRRGRRISSSVTPLGHMSVHPIEVGKAVWFLLNDDLSSAMTGTTLKTDRGASLLRPEW